MGGVRITTGEDSQQDYATDPAFMQVIPLAYREICMDLAAHAGNKQHARYIAPRSFSKVGTFDELSKSGLLDIPAATLSKVHNSKGVVKRNADNEELHEVVYPNTDTKAYAIDAFEQDWAGLSAKFASNNLPGLLWLNCEFNDTARWAARCAEEAKKGAHVLLLTPMAMTSWFEKFVLYNADVRLLIGRLCFDGKSPYSKDCMLSYFHPEGGKKIEIWDWRRNLIIATGVWSAEHAKRRDQLVTLKTIVKAIT